MTLRMRGGTLASFFLESGLLVFKTELEVVHTSIVRATCDVYLVIVLEMSPLCLFCLECCGKPALIRTLSVGLTAFVRN